MKFNFIKVMALSTVLLLSSKATASIISVESFLDGNTASTGFNITNGASSTANIVSLTFDVSLIGLVFDTELGGAYTNGNARPLIPTRNSDLATGLIFPYSVTDGSTEFTISFGSFNPGETFSWLIDLDFFSGRQKVFGSDLVGALLSISYDNGLTSLATYEAVSGNSNASQLVIVSTVGQLNVSEPAPFLLLIVGLAIISFRKLYAK